MARVIGFFDSEAETTSALDVLYAGDYGDADARVIETGREAADDVLLAATPQDTYASHPVGAVAMPADLTDMDFNDEEEAAWFARSLRNRGVLVVAEVEDKQAEAVQQLFRDQGGRTYKKE